MSIATIKAQVLSILTGLVTDEVLGAATAMEITKDPLAADHAAFPCAYLLPPAVESEMLDNRNNLRKYTFEILLLFNAENLASTSDVETTVEAVLDAFDNNPTLGGSALGGMSPLASAPFPYNHGGTDIIIVSLQVTAQEDVTLTF